ncbi:MAG: CAP domain-containing protein [Planctomycetota bacterium]|nr:CAP domain-containing protein [Planctomycetota bacterium]
MDWCRHGRVVGISLRQGACALVLACALALAGCGSGGTTAVPPGGAGTLSVASEGEVAWKMEVLALTNEVRAEYGLGPLTLDPVASQAAYEHAWDMHLRSFFDHVNPDGEHPDDRLARHGVQFDVARENLARGHASPREVVDAWMASPNHRANLLYPGWTHIGVAVHTGASQGPWWAQEFYR